MEPTVRFYPHPNTPEQYIDRLRPERATGRSAGVDLKAFLMDHYHLLPGETYAVPTGYCAELPFEAVGFICPRSGMSLKGVTVGNAPGIIDADYSDQLYVILHNRSEVPYIISPFTRIAQFVPLLRVVAITGINDPGAIRNGGLGSTGMGG